jgi:hypothetical protein
MEVMKVRTRTAGKLKRAGVAMEKMKEQQNLWMS